MAVANYESEYDRLPPNATDDGFHSWRTLILPFREDDVSKSIDWNSPWDSAANRQFHLPVPHGFQCHNREDGSASTQMFAVTGADSIWSADTFRMDKHALLLIELDLKNVCWMEPRDVTRAELLKTLQSNGKLPGPHPDGILMAFADFSVRFVPHEEITPAFLNSLFPGQSKVEP